MYYTKKLIRSCEKLFIHTQIIDYSFHCFVKSIADICSKVNSFLTLSLLQDYPDNLIRCPVCSKLTLLTGEGASGLPNAEHLKSFINIKEQFFLPLSYELASASCTTHRREMKLYCSTCSAGICLTCAVHDHKQHEFRPISMLN